jgi:pimeloyl-ACP methyl ester carboxylesterase
MPHVFTNGIRLSYERLGRGERVLLLMGSFAAGRVWSLHQAPALAAAGYQAVMLDNRGILPSDVPAGRYSMADMVADTRGVIEALELAPCRVVGTSMGALMAQELMIGWPGLVRCAVLIGTRARADAARVAQVAAQRAKVGCGVVLPGEYEASVSVLQMLSPATLNDDAAVSLWLETFGRPGGEAAAGGQAWVDTTADRRAELAGVRVPCRVISFADDLITPPHLAAEVAAAIPGCDLVQIPRCGHLGFLERPGEVNTAIIEFLDKN